MESKFVGNQMRNENSRRKVLSLKLLSLKKLENLPLSEEYGFRINAGTLCPVFTADSKINEIYSDTSVLFENSEKQVPSLKTLAFKKIKSLPTSSEHGSRIYAECLRPAFINDSKYCQRYSDPFVFSVNCGDCVPSLKILTLKRLKNLPSFREHTSADNKEILLLAPTVHSERGKTDSDSSDESYCSCVSDLDEYFEMEPVITLKFPEREIVMKKKEFLDHCYAVKNGAKRLFKNRHVLRQKYEMDTSGIENIVQHNLENRRKENGVQVYSNKDCNKKEFLDHCEAVKSGAKRTLRSRYILKQNFAMEASKNVDKKKHNFMLHPEEGDLLTYSDEIRQNEIVGKKKELLDHCKAVGSGAKQTLKNGHVLRQKFSMEDSKFEDKVQYNSMFYREEGGDLIYSDKDSHKNNNCSEYGVKNVCNLVNYFDSIVN